MVPVQGQTTRCQPKVRRLGGFVLAGLLSVVTISDSTAADFEITSASVRIGGAGFAGAYHYHDGHSAIAIAMRAGGHFRSTYCPSYGYRYSASPYYYPAYGPIKRHIYDNGRSYTTWDRPVIRSRRGRTLYITSDSRRSQVRDLHDRAFGPRDEVLDEFIEQPEAGPVVEAVERTIYYDPDGTRRVVIERRVYPHPHDLDQSPEAETSPSTTESDVPAQTESPAKTPSSTSGINPGPQPNPSAGSSEPSSSRPGHDDIAK